MTTLFLSSSFLPLSSHKPWHWHSLQHPTRKPFSFTVCASSSSNKSSRSSRKVKSNQELYYDIIEFLSTVGLPKSHVPSMKELSHHGRNDLANIVRRRGYKFIRQLLESSTETDLDGFVAEKTIAGQDQNVTNEIEDVSLLVDVPSVGDCFGSTDTDTNFNSVNHYYMRIESSANSLLQVAESSTLNSQNDNVNNIVEDISLSTDISLMKNPSSGSCTSMDLNSDGYSLPPAESSSNSPFAEKVSPNINGHHDKTGDLTENISSLANLSIMENHSSSSNLSPSLNFDGYMSLESSYTETLEEKVANFIQNGDLDVIEDNVYGTLNESDDKESDDKESEAVIELEDSMEVKSKTRGVEHLEQIFNDRIDRTMTLNGSALRSKLIAFSATVNRLLSDDHLGTEIGGADFDSLEAWRRENQVEINHLKFMLHQKEMELSRLKEQIEKEKIALSVLQTKAETEINKAQKLISDKDEELITAEESLSGLEEVEIQYSGDGEIVEVAGSFNGWHHQIKMDPLPSSSIIEPIGSRKSGLWSTVLWLYPGTYELKFIVDGQWKIDPQRESVSKDGICNNILQVNR